MARPVALLDASPMVVSSIKTQEVSAVVLNVSFTSPVPNATASTYCFGAIPNAVTGSAATVLVVSTALVNANPERLPDAAPLNVGAAIVGVPASVYVPVADPDNTGFDMVGLVIVGVPANVYVPVIDPEKIGAVSVLFDNASDPAIVAKSASEHAVLN